MAINGQFTISAELRPCRYKGEQRKFHRWFQEGNSTSDGVDLGAVLEDMDGNISKVWDIQNIKFVSTESTNLCDDCLYGCMAHCPSLPGDTVYGNGIGNDNVVLCKHHKEDDTDAVPAGN